MSMKMHECSRRTETMDMRATCEPTAAGASALEVFSSMIEPMVVIV